MSQASAHPIGRLVHIQYLRGIAALMVVFHHMFKARPGFFSPLGQSDFGYAGVLTFFVISGFVMMHACRNEPATTFATRRLIRVVPLYWVMTLVYYVLLARDDVAAGEPFRRVPELFYSLFFIPHYHLGEPDKIWPLLVPGWTLNYEMFFFLIFFVGIAVQRVRLVATGLLILLVLVGAVFDSGDPRFLTWTSPLLLLFLAGMSLSMLWHKFDFSRLVLLLPLGLCLTVAAAMGWLPADLRLPGFFVAAVTTVAGTLAVQRRWPKLEIRPLAWIGDASYSIYLSHTILMIVLYKFLRMLPLTGWPQFFVASILVATLCTLFGIGLYQALERPMIRFFRKRFDPGMTGGRPTGSRALG